MRIAKQLLKKQKQKQNQKQKQKHKQKQKQRDKNHRRELKRKNVHTAKYHNLFPKYTIKKN